MGLPRFAHRCPELSYTFAQKVQNVWSRCHWIYKNASLEQNLHD